MDFFAWLGGLDWGYATVAQASASCCRHTDRIGPKALGLDNGSKWKRGTIQSIN